MKTKIDEKILELANILKNTKYLVFFGGAGTSTDSGIKDFRGKNGLFKTLFKGKYKPDEILSLDFFKNNRELFIEYVTTELITKNIQINKGHIALKKLEDIDILKSVITQNIDGLHQLAGSKNILELHGNLNKWYCLACGKTKDSYFDCECGGIVRPDITLYGENLKQKVINEAICQIEQADTLIVAGTSLTVYPASEYLTYFKGKNLIIINETDTQYGGKISLEIIGNFSYIMDKVIEFLNFNEIK